MKHFYRLALAAMLLLSFSITAFPQSWTAMTDFAGAGRNGAVSFTIGDYAYVGLGKDADNYYVDFYKYDPSTDSWVQIADFPGTARQDAVAFTVNGIAYVGTGYTDDPSATYFKDFYAYNPATNSWSAISDFSGSARSSAVAFAIGDFGYVGTGIDASDETKDFYKYNPSTDTWSSIANLASGKRKGAVGFAINGKGYVSGGGYADFKKGSFQHSDVYSYDPAANSWSEEIFADGINLPFQSASVFVVNARAYICYGNQDHVAVYDPSDNSVQNKGDAIGLGSDRYSGVAFSINNKGYFGTGSYTEWKWTTIYNTDIWQFTPPNPPTDIILSPNSVEEGVSSGSLVGTFEAVDADPGDSHTFSMIEEAGYDHYTFTLDGNELTINYVPDYEQQQSTYVVLIEVEDEQGFTFRKDITIYIEDINEGIRDVDLSSDNIDENLTPGSVVGEFIVYDYDDEDEHTFSFINDAGNEDSIYFHLDGNQLIADSSFNYEDRQTFTVMLATEDTAGHVKESTFYIDINNVNESPYDIIISTNKIDEDAIGGSAVAYFTTEDTDNFDSADYSMVDGNGTNDKDNDKFTIDGSQLVLNADIDPEEQSEFSIYVSTTDEGGLHFEKSFTLTVGSSTEVDDLGEVKIAAYPNPTSGKLYLELVGEVQDALTLTLFNSLGAVVKQQVVNQKKTILHMEDLPSGVYFLQVEEAPAYPVIRILKK